MKTTLQRAVKCGSIGKSPVKKGKEAKIDHDYLWLVAIHAHMEQVGTRGDGVGPIELQAVMMTGVLKTVHKGSFNQNYAWRMVWKENSNILVPHGMMNTEDICWQWVTYENLDQWFSD